MSLEGDRAAGRLNGGGEGGESWPGASGGLSEGLGGPWRPKCFSRLPNAPLITISYGLEQRVQRRVNGRWRNAAKQIYGTSQPGFRLIAYSVEPGKRSRPRADRITLPDGLDRGTYRILKRVNAGPTDLDTNATLKATFLVR